MCARHVSPRGRARGNKVKRQIYDKRHREHGIENNLIKFIKTENYAFVRHIQCAAAFFCLLILLDDL